MIETSQKAVAKHNCNILHKEKRCHKTLNDYDLRQDNTRQENHVTPSTGLQSQSGWRTTEYCISLNSK